MFICAFNNKACGYFQQATHQSNMTCECSQGITTHTLMKMETGLLYTRVDTGSSLLCFYKDAAQKDASRLKPGMCSLESNAYCPEDLT
jgi:hypothetical protein